MARVSVVVEDRDKERWEEHAAAYRDYHNTSDLVRRSVEKQIKRDYEQSERGTEGPAGIREATELILDKLESMDNDLQQLKETPDLIADVKQDSQEIENSITALRKEIKDLENEKREDDE